MKISGCSCPNFDLACILSPYLRTPNQISIYLPFLRIAGMGKKKNWLKGLKKALTSQSKDAGNVKSPKEKNVSGFRKQKHSESVDLDAVQQKEEGAVYLEAIEQNDSPSSDKAHSEAGIEQNQHALAIAVATAAAAEAAVAAAQAAAQVAGLTEGTCTRCAGNSEEVAAIEIQTAFRAYLARRTLRALKGLGRLQSLVDGQNVKNQATNTLRCMQTLVKVQSQVHERRRKMSEENKALQKQLLQKRAKELEDIQANIEAKEWDDSLQSKEDIETSLQSKKEAAIRRERALAYAYSHQTLKNAPQSAHQMLMEIDPNKPSWGWSWLDRWMAACPWEKEGPEILSAKCLEHNTGDTEKQVSYTGKGLHPQTLDAHTRVISKPRQKYSKPVGQQSSFTTSSKSSIRSRFQNSRPSSVRSADEDVRSVASLRSERPRHGSQGSLSSSVQDDESLGSLGSSSAVPRYMAPTESTIAKRNSHSSRSQRSGISDTASVSSAKSRLSFPLTDGGKYQTKPKRGQGCSHSNPKLKRYAGSVRSAGSITSIQDLSISLDNALLSESGEK